MPLLKIPLQNSTRRFDLFLKGGCALFLCVQLESMEQRSHRNTQNTCRKTETLARAKLMNKGILSPKSSLCIGCCDFHGQDCRYSGSQGTSILLDQRPGWGKACRKRKNSHHLPFLPTSLTIRELAGLSFNCVPV